MLPSTPSRNGPPSRVNHLTVGNPRKHRRHPRPCSKGCLAAPCPRRCGRPEGSAEIVRSRAARRHGGHSAISPASTKLREACAVTLEQARQRSQRPQPGLLNAVAAALLQEPAATATRPSLERGRPGRTARARKTHSVRRGSPSAAVLTTHGGRRSRPLHTRHPCRPSTRATTRRCEVLEPQPALPDEPLTGRRTRHPTSVARTNRGLALLDRPLPSALSRYGTPTR